MIILESEENLANALSMVGVVANKEDVVIMK